MADFKIKGNLAVQGTNATVNGVDVVTTSASQALSNKTIDASANTISNIPSSALAGSIDATKIADGSVTNTEFQYLSTVTSNVQDQLDDKVPDTRTVNGHALTADVTVTKSDVSLGNVDNVQQLPLSYLDTDGALTADSDTKVASQKATKAYADTKIPLSQKGANSGVATLDSGGKIPVTQLPNSIMEYLGTWAASTNTPTLANGTGNAGDVYVASDAGSVDFGAGSIAFLAGDWVVYSGSVWEKSVNSNSVASVNGQTGAVVLDTDDISEGTAKYFSDELAQDAVGAMIADTATVNLTYTDATPELKADVIVAAAGALDTTSGLAVKVDNSTVEIATNALQLKDSAVTNAKVAAAAAIARSKLASGTADHVVINSATGVFSSEAQLAISRGGTGASTAATAFAALAPTPATKGDMLVYDGSSYASLPIGGDGAFLKAEAAQSQGLFWATINTLEGADIVDTQFTVANNQGSPTNVVGLSFSGAIVSAFEALVTVQIDATADLYESFKLHGVYKTTSNTWEMSQTSVGDDSLVVFSITSGGNIQYTSPSYAGYVSGKGRFRAFINYKPS